MKIHFHSNLSANYKWMNRQEEFLKNNFQSGTIAHAFLFSGDNEKIKSFVKELVQTINCQSDKKPCGTCIYCSMINKEGFPDLLVIKSAHSKSSKENERDMMEINIEQVREAQNFLGHTAYYGNYKAVIVENAERMNTEAQSCFLKTLEEPKGKTVIFLVTRNPDFLMPTIASRCQQVKFIERQSAEFAGSEQKILENIKNVLGKDLAEKFNFVKNANLEEDNFEAMMTTLQKYFRKILLSKLGIGTPQTDHYSVETLSKALRTIEQLQYQNRTANINKKLALELLFLNT